MGLAYRSGQFFRALTARLTPNDLVLAEEFLPACLRPLFHRLRRPDQVHAISVLRSVLLSGERDPDLLAAALLHDVGKTAVPLHLWERVLIVLAGRLSPKATRRWGQAHPQGWRRAFVVARRHPEWGAAMVRQAGGSERLVNLILHHQVESEGTSPNPDPLLAILRRADGDN